MTWSHTVRRLPYARKIEDFIFARILIASVGVSVPKISASGSISGAIDTMAIIPGFDSRLTPERFERVLATCGFAHIEQTNDICPADHALIQARRRANLMACPPLAAASLLGKKLAIPGTCAAFDFRVGATGNIGSTEAEAVQAATIFFRSAESLGMVISATLTDNSTFPCSALGRIECLDLLEKFVTPGTTLLDLDVRHLNCCIQISASACGLARGKPPRDTYEQLIRSNLASGRVLDTLRRHLETQGASLEGLHQVCRSLDSQASHTVSATGRGWWTPPDIAVVKGWMKAAQQDVLRKLDSSTKDPRSQVGMRLLVDPGSRVELGQPVIRVSYPQGASLDPLPESMVGSFSDHPPKDSPHPPRTYEVGDL